MDDCHIGYITKLRKTTLVFIVDKVGYLCYEKLFTLIKDGKQL